MIMTTLVRLVGNTHRHTHVHTHTHFVSLIHGLQDCVTFSAGHGSVDDALLLLAGIHASPLRQVGLLLKQRNV